jgi:hypothetical protein
MTVLEIITLIQVRTQGAAILVFLQTYLTDHMYNSRVLKTGQDSYTNDSTIDIGLSGMIPAQSTLCCRSRTVASQI